MTGLCEKGLGAAIIFVVQRNDAFAFAPNSKTDPLFGEALQTATRAGVGVFALRCRVSRHSILLGQAIPIRTA